MSIIPFPRQARPLHPAFGGGSPSRSRARFVEDASTYGITAYPDSPIDSARMVAKQHLFRLGFGECPSVRRVDGSSPIVARNGSSVIGVVVGCGDYSANDIVRARSAAQGEAVGGDTVSAAVMTVRFVDAPRLRVEIVIAGDDALHSIPPVPFE